jgi:hypothetical protein
MTHTVANITELIHYHLVLAEDSDERANANLAELVSRISQMRTRALFRTFEWLFCDTCGCTVDVDVLAEDGSNFTFDGGFYCSECIPGRDFDH